MQTARIFEGMDQQSGGTRPGRRLSYPEQQQVHTEGKILKKISGRTKPGDILTIRGNYEPCPMCDPIMRAEAERLQIKIFYSAEETGATFRYP
jgi:Pput_2613-like deaminase